MGKLAPRWIGRGVVQSLATVEVLKGITFWVPFFRCFCGIPFDVNSIDTFLTFVVRASARRSPHGRVHAAPSSCMQAPFAPFEVSIDSVSKARRKQFSAGSL